MAGICFLGLRNKAVADYILNLIGLDIQLSTELASGFHVTTPQNGFIK